jgi:hypothetical protein
MTSRPLLPCLLASISWLAGCQPPPSIGEGDGTGTGSESASETNPESTSTDDSSNQICEPGETRCADPNTLETCEADGLAWGSMPCDAAQICDPCPDQSDCSAACVVACDYPHGAAGCSHMSTSLYQSPLPMGVTLTYDSLVVANPDPNHTANVDLYYISEFDSMEVLELNATLAPGEAHAFVLSSGVGMDTGPLETSLFRGGGVYHVVSDYPIVAYLHAPQDSLNGNGSTLLLPEHALGSEHYIHNHGAWVEPNYFVVIAVEDDTVLTWVPSVETAGDDMPVPFVDAGATGMMVLDRRYDNVRIETSGSLNRPRCEQDLSGSFVTADKPIWVLSGLRGLRLPWCGNAPVTGCQTIVDDACNQGSDLAIEQNIPLDSWGTQYVGAHSPVRGTESHWWRIYAGADNVTVTTNPPQMGTPIVLANAGDWAEIILPTGTNVVFDGDGPFMPVQYVSGHHDSGTAMGSPAMIQAVPTDRYLDRYVFMTPVDYEQHYAQVIRAAGSADVMIDGNAVGNWEVVGAWEIANVMVSEGTHEVWSDDPFSLAQYGYSQHVDSIDNSAGYAYVVGLDLE